MALKQILDLKFIDPKQVISYLLEVVNNNPVPEEAGGLFKLWMGKNDFYDRLRY